MDYAALNLGQRRFLCQWQWLMQRLVTVHVKCDTDIILSPRFREHHERGGRKDVKS